MNWLRFSTIAMVVAAGVFAAASRSGAQDRSESGAVGRVFESGELHLESSRVYVHVGKTGLGHEHGVVGMLKLGLLRLDEERDAGEIVFDMTTFAADSDVARKHVGLSGATDVSTQRQVTANMLGADVLDVRRYPTAAFKIESVKRLREASRRGLPQFQLDGDFTLHGVTRPIQIVADAEEKGSWVHLRGGFSMLQSDFGITPYSKAFGAVGVADKLQISADLWLSKERQVVPAPAQR